MLPLLLVTCSIHLETVSWIVIIVIIITIMVIVIIIIMVEITLGM